MKQEKRKYTTAKYKCATQGCNNRKYHDSQQKGLCLNCFYEKSATVIKKNSSIEMSD